MRGCRTAPQRARFLPARRCGSTAAPGALRCGRVFSLELGKDVTSDLRTCVVATANETRMKPRIVTLRTDGGTIVGAVSRVKSGEIVIQSPTPLHGSGVEDPGAAARLVDGHPPVEPVIRPIGPGIAAEVLGRPHMIGTNWILVTDRIQLTAGRVEGLPRSVPPVEVLPVEVGWQSMGGRPTISGSLPASCLNLLRRFA